MRRRAPASGRALAALLAACTLALGACETERLDHGVTQGASADGGPGDGGTGDGGTEGFLVSGTVTGDAGHIAPPFARIIVVWQAGQDGEERLYKLGDGTANATTFTVRLPTPPGPSAMVNGQTGLGFVYLVASNVQVADGEVTHEWLEHNTIGADPTRLVVYRGALGPAYTWLSAFPQGFSCAKRGVGEEHAHTVADCAALAVSVGDIDTFDFVTWH